MVSSAFEAAQNDLAVLSPPPGLTQGLFTAYVSGILKQMPLLTQIDKLASTGLTDTKAQEFFAGQIGDDSDTKQIWRVIKEWLVFFFPDTYRLQTAEQVLVKGRQLSKR